MMQLYLTRNLPVFDYIFLLLFIKGYLWKWWLMAAGFLGTEKFHKEATRAHAAQRKQASHESLMPRWKLDAPTLWSWWLGEETSPGLDEPNRSKARLTTIQWLLSTRKNPKGTLVVRLPWWVQFLYRNCGQRTKWLSRDCPLVNTSWKFERWICRFFVLNVVFFLLILSLLSTKMLTMWSITRLSFLT